MKSKIQALLNESLFDENDLNAINLVLQEMKSEEPLPKEEEPKEEEEPKDEDYESEEAPQVDQDIKDSLMSKLYNDEVVLKDELEACLDSEEALEECLNNIKQAKSRVNYEDTLDLIQDVVQDNIDGVMELKNKLEGMYNDISHFRAMNEDKLGESQDAILEGYTKVKPIKDEAKEAQLHANEIKAQEWQEYLKNEA